MTDQAGNIPLDQVDTTGMSKGQLKKHKDKLKVFLAEKAAKEGGGATEEKKEEAGGNDDAVKALEAIDTSEMSAGQLKKHKQKIKDAKAAAGGGGAAEAKPAAAAKGGKKLNAAAAAALKKREDAAALQAEIDAENAKLDAEFNAKQKLIQDEKDAAQAIIDAKKKDERELKQKLKDEGKWLSKKELAKKREREAKEKELEELGFYKREDGTQETGNTTKKASQMVKKGKNKNYKKQEEKPAEEEKPTEVKEEVKETKKEEKVEEKKVQAPAEDEESEIDDWDAADSDELAAKLDKKDVIVLDNNEEDNNLAETVKQTEQKVNKTIKGGEKQIKPEGGKADTKAAGVDIFAGGNDDDDAKAARAARRAENMAKIAARKNKKNKDTTAKFRCPIVCIMGHVDTGKTLILDKLRRTNVQAGEAGGITQQIGATFFPPEYIQGHCDKVKDYIPIDLRLPGFLVIDTPGHESFTNLRSRGSSLCDIAILVVDIVHYLEPQTRESMELLRQKKCPFIVALNKIDRIYEWKSEEYNCVQSALKNQGSQQMSEFENRVSQTVVQFAEEGFNACLYWDNQDVEDYLSLVPTSAITGEGLPDLMSYLSLMCQTRIPTQLYERNDQFDCTVLEVKIIEGLGTTIDVVLVNGVLKVQDTIVLQGFNGAIVTQVRALLTPHPMKEMRVKAEYIHHKEIKGAMGIKISAPGLEQAIAGAELIKCKGAKEIEEAKQEIESSIIDIMDKFVNKNVPGVCVQASTLGSLEALLQFLKDAKISVCNISIGPVHKKDVLKAMKVLAMEDKNIKKEFATILAFDVRVSPEAQKFADEEGIKIFTAEIIYHLFDSFTEYVKQCKEERMNKGNKDAIYPCVLEVMKDAIFNRKDPIIIGVNVLKGQLRVGTPICVPERENLRIGVVEAIERNKNKVNSAIPKDGSVSVRISGQSNINYGSHFDHTNQLCSWLTRRSIDALKEHCREEMSMDDWHLVKQLKEKYGVDAIKM